MLLDKGETFMIVATKIMLPTVDVFTDLNTIIRVLAIRERAFGACFLRGLPAAGSLRSPLPLALAPHPHTLSSTIKISKIALFRFLASGGLGGHHRHRLNLTPPDEKMSCAAFQKTASYVLNSPRYDEQVSNAAF